MEGIACSYASDAVDKEDLFYVVNSAEEELTQNGYKEGFNAGKKSGFIEGKSMGQSKGSQISREIGYYYGFCRTFVSTMQTHHNLSKSQQKGLSIFSEICLNIKKIDDYSPAIVKELTIIRSKFKQACTLLNLDKKLIDNFSLPSSDF